MDLRKVKTLIELVESSGIGELEIQEGEERIRITRASSATAQTVMVNAAPMSLPPSAGPGTPSMVSRPLPSLGSVTATDPTVGATRSRSGTVPHRRSSSPHSPLLEWAWGRW